ncbi:MAG TPA: hypothetical protein P5323_02235 [Candidatus Moranbacteria bacterium]|nr:hypothetical protein [Candidatus Moranbacteria bacterium]HRY27931.1 hypothetical protein [Candidatus Moranbacteria bacterium]HSA08616.1 hypothetical protein [Candidatus Moranbacteria bacterium]
MNERTRLFLYLAYKIGLHVFALVGFVLVGGFFAVRWHWTDAQGSIDVNNNRFQESLTDKNANAGEKVLGVETQDNSESSTSLDELNFQIKKLSEKKELKSKNYCLIDVIGQYSPQTSAKIIEIYNQTDSDALISKMILAARIRIEEKNGGSSVFANCDYENAQTNDAEINKKYAEAQGKTLFPWMDNEEWETIRQAIMKDKDLIEKAAATAGIEPRLLVSCAIVEQVRLFNSSRELFKQFFQPLKILGNANKISLGIMGVKENTAIQIENNLKDQSSPYYLGPELEKVLDYTDGSDGDKRYARLTEDSHYYSYLYGALYLKQFETQWKKADYDIKYRPEIAGTLFNVGFPQSKPNPNPKVGGSKINIYGSEYTFGSLAYEFYYSGELVDAFPYNITKK